MPRQPRLIVAGYPYHLIIRGNSTSAVFYSEKDRHCFIACLLEVKEAAGCLIYSYCPMTNHVHLLAEAETEDGIKRMI